MVSSSASTVEEYLKALPADRREAIEAVRKVILKSIPKGVEEGMQYGMIGYYIPHSEYPAGYHCDPKQPLPYISLASQKNHMAVYMFCLYCNEEWKKDFIEAYQATGKKLDVGASCVRFKKLENLPLDVLEKSIKKVKLKDFIKSYEQGIAGSGGKKKK